LVVVERVTTYEELARFWSLDDVAKACDVLDIKSVIQDKLTPPTPKGK
jgi:hypothetical protein